MISRKLAHRIEWMGFVLCVFIHFIYAFFFRDTEIALQVLMYAIGTAVIASSCLLVFKNEIWAQTGFILCIMGATHLIGESLDVLAFGVCIYMVAGTLIALIGNKQVSIRFMVMANFSIAFGLIVEYGSITSRIGLGYYMLLVVFFEAFLITENYIVTVYQRKVEEVQEQNELLNIAQRSKDEFLANMSHEIRTPMNAIVGMSELILREDTNDKVKEYCHNIQSSGENLLGIINDILDFSKIESGKVDIIYEPYSIASLIQDVANTAMFRRGFKDISIIIDCSPGMPQQLYGDVLRNRQILMNIVGNAVKYTEEGYVFISLTCHEKNGENWLQMQVTDTGIGIKQEEQIHLFESFSRLDTKRNRSVEGTGLGLAICKRLTDAMHGTIGIVSKYGAGTTVTVDIPQRIEEPGPFLTLKNKDIKVVLYGDKDLYHSMGDYRYRMVYEDTWKELGVSYRFITDFVELMHAVENDEMTHIFIGADEYTDQRSYFEQIARYMKVFVLIDPQYPIRLGENVHEVHMPFYSINLVSALKGEAFYNQFIDEKEIKIAFKAPMVKALVVDDNDINLRVAEGILKLYNINCVLASSGKEAIELLKEQDIDIVFMDHMMPELDGVETTRIIRRTGGEYGKQLPIIALTANVVNDAKQMFLANGFQDFIPKPVGLKSIDAVLRRWLPGEKLMFIDEKMRKKVPVFNENGEEEMEDNAEGEQSFTMMHIDEEKALENMGGMRDLYKELLEYCLAEEQQRKQEINESFEKQDWKDYVIRVHALKGGMRSLGVEELAFVAQTQEFAGKEDRIDDLIAGHAHLLEEYERGHRSIEEYLKHFQI